MSQFYNKKIEQGIENFLEELKKADEELDKMFIDLMDLYCFFDYNHSVKNFNNDFNYIYEIVDLKKINGVLEKQNKSNFDVDKKIIEKYQNIKIFSSEISIVNIKNLVKDYKNQVENLRQKSYTKYVNLIQEFEDDINDL